MDSHIRNAFDQDLESIQAMIMKMGGLVEQALLDAAEALEQRDKDLAQRVRRGDEAIDALEHEIHTECARIIAIRTPTAKDLRTVLTVIRIAGALERAGDHAKNIAKRSLELSQMPPIKGTFTSIARMARAVVALLRDALDAYITHDSALALDVRNRDVEIDESYNALFHELMVSMTQDSENIPSCMHLHFIARDIERVGDHATTVAEQVIYLVSGHLPEDERPKVETSGISALEGQS